MLWRHISKIFCPSLDILSPLRKLWCQSLKRVTTGLPLLSFLDVMSKLIQKFSGWLNNESLKMPSTGPWLWYTFVRFLRTVRQDLIIWFTREAEYLRMCQPPQFTNHQEPCTTKKSNEVKWPLVLTLLQQSRPNCLHWEHMLDSRLDSSECIRPAVIKDHLNKEMTVTAPKLLHWRQSEFYLRVWLAMFRFGVRKVSVSVAGEGGSFKKHHDLSMFIWF